MRGPALGGSGCPPWQSQLGLGFSASPSSKARHRNAPIASDRAPLTEPLQQCLDARVTGLGERRAGTSSSPLACHRFLGNILVLTQQGSPEGHTVASLTPHALSSRLPRWVLCCRLSSGQSSVPIEGVWARVQWNQDRMRGVWAATAGCAFSPSEHFMDLLLPLLYPRTWDRKG